jgi:hypothetical protein
MTKPQVFPATTRPLAPTLSPRPPQRASLVLMAQHPPDPDPISTVAESPRIVGLVVKDKPGPIVIAPEPAADLVNAPARSEPTPELTFGARVGPQGARVVTLRALGTPAVVLLLIAVVVRILTGGVTDLVRELRRPDAGRCTEHIERTTHTEYIERTCGS